MVDQPTSRDWSGVIALGLIWGGTFMVVAMALEGYGPVTVATARTTLGAVTLLGMMALTGRKLPTGDLNLWGFIAIIGLLSTALPFMLLSWGQQYVASAFAGLSMAAIPPPRERCVGERTRLRDLAGSARRRLPAAPFAAASPPAR